MINKTSKVAARSLTAITLIIMIIISCISAVAVNKDTTQTGASKDLETVGAQMTQGLDYYLIGSLPGYSSWTQPSEDFKLSKIDNNHYTGTFKITGQATYQFKIYNSNRDYYSKPGTIFKSGSTTVTGLVSGGSNNNMTLSVSGGKSELKVDMYCEHSGDSRLTIELIELNDDGTYRGGTGHKYNADPNVVNHSPDTKLLNVKSTFFDYYNDEEIDGKWRDSLTGFYRTVKSGDSKYNREPYQKLNRAIAQYANGVNNSLWTTPLYFGDFNTDREGFQKNGYEGYGVSSLKKFLSVPNNSNATSSGTSGSVAGLADVTLASNKKLSKNGVTMPYFDEDWLVKNGYGTVVHSDFPMRKTTDKHGSDYYEYDSLDGKDNCYFDGYENLASGGNLTMNYASGKSNSVYDALSGFSDSTTNNPGFFPFDRRSDHSNNGYDFGFGMRLDLDFTLGAYGKTNGKDTVFNFSGDDDLWVYLDGVLVLDMGGDHKMSQGCIDFTTLKSYVNNIDTTYQGSDLVYKNDTSKSGYGYSAEFPLLFSDSTARTGSSEFNNNNVNAHHTLTVFYMERGMIESNLKVGFNFEPITDSLDVTKKVDTSGVNSKLQSAVENADDFGFNFQTSESENTGYTDTNDKRYTYSDGSAQYKAKTNGNTATLGNGDRASFNSQFNVGNYIKVSEGEPKETLVSNLDTSNLIYLYTDSNSVSWFNNNSVPAISFDDGATFHQMISYVTDNKTVYYYESEKDSNDKNKNFIIGRKAGSGVYNQVSFDAIDENSNCILVKSWSSSNNRTKNNGNISYVSKSTFASPSGSESTIDTTKSSNLTYDTKWSLHDLAKPDENMPSGEGKTSTFEYINSDKDTYIPTHLRLDYVNTPKVANIKVTKTVQDQNKVKVDDDTQFTVTLKLDLKGGTNYQDYGLTGTISQNSSYIFEKIPVGASYEITESTPSGYKVSYGTTNKNEGTLGNSGATVDVINTVTPTSITAGITKTLDSMVYDGSTFQFKLVGLAPTTVGGVTTEDTHLVTDTVSTVVNGSASFSSIEYSTEGTYLYKITEEPLVDGHDYQTDSSVYIFKVVVAKDNGVLKATGTYYSGTSSQSVDKIIKANNTTNIASFVNTSTKAQATVTKVDKVNPDGTVPADAKKLKGAEFTLYKVDADRSKDNMVKVATATTDSNGELTFTDLDIFKSGKNGNGGTKEYQWYYVVETAAAEGYTLSTNEQWFSFDVGNYDTTKNCYTHSFVALNTLITVPYAGINYLMQHNFILYGTLVLGLGAICSCGYMLRKRRLGAKAPTNKHGRK